MAFTIAVNIFGCFCCAVTAMLYASIDQWAQSFLYGCLAALCGAVAMVLWQRETEE